MYDGFAITFYVGNNTRRAHRRSLHYHPWQHSHQSDTRSAYLFTDNDPTSGKSLAPFAGVRIRRVRAAETLHPLQEVCSSRVTVARLRHHHSESHDQPTTPWVWQSRSLSRCTSLMRPGLQFCPPEPPLYSGSRGDLSL